MHPDLIPILAADVDFGQVIMVIVFLVAAFVNWLFNMWKQKKEASERARELPTQEETDMRRRAWEEQNRRVETPPATHRTPPPAPSSGGGSLKELFEELKRAAQEAQAPSAPPPLSPPPQPVHRPAAPPLPAQRAHPVPSLPEAVPAHERSSINKPALAPQHSHAASARQASHAYDVKAERRKGAHPLAALLHTSVGYQQAFILKEILDTPKGIRNTPWDNDPN
jgi:FtsZ-interacting cell division protein ZipA